MFTGADKRELFKNMEPRSPCIVNPKAMAFLPESLLVRSGRKKSYLNTNPIYLTDALGTFFSVGLSECCQWSPVPWPLAPVPCPLPLPAGQMGTCHRRPLELLKLVERRLTCCISSE